MASVALPLLSLIPAACGDVFLEPISSSEPGGFEATATSTTTGGPASSSSAGGGGAGGSGGIGGTGGGPGGGGAGGGGGSGPVSCDQGAPPQIVSVGGGPGLLLRGLIATPDIVFQGEVLIVGTDLVCVAPSCAALPEAATATVVETNGTILPGLIDTHSHILFNLFDETDFTPQQGASPAQWANDPKYVNVLDAKQYLNGEQSPVSYNCELEQYGELKGLVAGTTSVVTAANPGNKSCYGSLARTIDQIPNDLPTDKVQIGTLIPSPATADGVCANFATGKTDAYLIHLAEGFDQAALSEFVALGSFTTLQGCLYDARTAIVQGTALGDPELSAMAAVGMKLVWSPRSNVVAYGGGSDLTKTADIPLALSKGITVALGVDYSFLGSQNLLDELRFADALDNAVWGDVLTPQLLTEMVTLNAAKVLGLSNTLGSLEVGKRADVLVLSCVAPTPYESLLLSSPANVRLVLVDGVTLYGDDALKSMAPQMPGCELLDVCGEPKFVCVAESSTPGPFGYTLADLQTTLTDGLAAYDALSLSPWPLSPPAPLFKCP